MQQNYGMMFTKKYPAAKRLNFPKATCRRITKYFLFYFPKAQLIFYLRENYTSVPKLNKLKINIICRIVGFGVLEVFA